MFEVVLSPFCSLSFGLGLEVEVVIFALSVVLCDVVAGVAVVVVDVVVKFSEFVPSDVTLIARSRESCVGLNS